MKSNTASPQQFPEPATESGPIDLGRLRPNSRSPARALIAAGVLLIFLGGLLATLEYHAGKEGPSAGLALNLLPADYAEPFLSPAIAFTSHELFCHIRAAAPVENSWMVVEMTALDADSLDVGNCTIKLSHIRDSAGATTWSQKESSGSIMLPKHGSYRFRFTARAGLGSGKIADDDNVAGKPLQIGISHVDVGARRFRLAGFAACIAIGSALLLAGLNRRWNSPSEAASPAAPRKSSGERMVFIDGLRGIACLGVLGCHFLVPSLSALAPSLNDTLPFHLPDFLQHGDMGVEIFFVLSGFVIAYSLRDRSVSGSLAARFVFRRALRLDPPYHVMLVFACALWAFFEPDSLYGLGVTLDGWRGTLANAFYLQDVLRFTSPLGIAWTLCLEIQFYLGFIVLVVGAQALARQIERTRGLLRRQATPLAILIVFAPLAILSLAVWYPERANVTFFGTWFRFFLGVLTFWTLQGRVPRAVLLTSIGVVLAASAGTHDLRGAVAGITALLIFVVGARGQLTHILAGSVWQFFGRISYSLYLVHVVVGITLINWLWAVTPHSHAAALLLFAGGIGTSIAVAHLFHVTLERPSMKLSKLVRY